MDIEVVGQADAVVANLQCIGITPAALQTDPDGACASLRKAYLRALATSVLMIRTQAMAMSMSRVISSTSIRCWIFVFENVDVGL